MGFSKEWDLLQVIQVFDSMVNGLVKAIRLFAACIMWETKSPIQMSFMLNDFTCYLIIHDQHLIFLRCNSQVKGV